MAKKTVLITGTSKGIGKELAQTLLQSGYRVIGIARSEAKLEGEYTHIRCDLTDGTQIEALEPQALACDVVFNCAGVGYFQPLETMRPEDIEHMLDLNLKAPALLCHRLLRTLRERRGHIVNISSVEAKQSSRFSAVYSATKAGLLAFSNSLFQEVRKSGVKVTTVHLGMTQTQFFEHLNFECSDDTHCFLQAAEVAAMLRHLIETPRQMVASEITIEPQKVGVKKKPRR